MLSSQSELMHTAMHSRATVPFGQDYYVPRQKEQDLETEDAPLRRPTDHLIARESHV